MHSRITIGMITVGPWEQLINTIQDGQVFWSCSLITLSFLAVCNNLQTGRYMVTRWTIGSLSKDVFERRTSTGSEVFSLFICLDTTKFVLLSFFSPIKTIYPRVSTKPQPNAAKSPLPVDVRRSKTPLLKLPIFSFEERKNKTGKLIACYWFP